MLGVVLPLSPGVTTVGSMEMVGVVLPLSPGVTTVVFVCRCNTLLLLFTGVILPLSPGVTTVVFVCRCNTLLLLFTGVILPLYPGVTTVVLFLCADVTLYCCVLVSLLSLDGFSGHHSCQSQTPRTRDCGYTETCRPWQSMQGPPQSSLTRIKVCTSVAFVGNS